ncbi:hypothetical protein EGR_09033 [Echinococcus granulosus]|uniref:Uncharacterized protein n=1 Tax=Echinococcus granulosus TaxID=6210 RepID=W6URS3_ECHGR|nr:hypothetical protein EGR_09033 [Echinococcus granulosus]EUB56094.1 hypothetical protein EGR_09033 [Echinococcus granulosus]
MTPAAKNHQCPLSERKPLEWDYSIQQANSKDSHIHTRSPTWNQFTYNTPDTAREQPLTAVHLRLFTSFHSSHLPDGQLIALCSPLPITPSFLACLERHKKLRRHRKPPIDPRDVVPTATSQRISCTPYDIQLNFHPIRFALYIPCRPDAIQFISFHATQQPAVTLAATDAVTAQTLGPPADTITVASTAEPPTAAGAKLTVQPARGSSLWREDNSVIATDPTLYNCRALFTAANIKLQTDKVFTILRLISHSVIEVNVRLFQLSLPVCLPASGPLRSSAPRSSMSGSISITNTASTYSTSCYTLTGATQIAAPSILKLRADSPFHIVERKQNGTEGNTAQIHRPAMFKSENLLPPIGQSLWQSAPRNARHPSTGGKSVSQQHPVPTRSMSSMRRDATQQREPQAPASNHHSDCIHHWQLGIHWGTGRKEANNASAGNMRSIPLSTVYSEHGHTGISSSASPENGNNLGTEKSLWHVSNNDDECWCFAAVARISPLSASSGMQS